MSMSESDSRWKETDRLFGSSGKVESTKPSSGTRFGFLFHIPFLTFVLLEFSFAAFTWICFRQELRLPYVDYSNFTAAKSGFVAAFNAWHSLAVAFGLNTCFESFSREWAARPERTDTVSTICSGMLDRTTYFFKQRATKTFKAALFVFLALMLLRTTGSSALTVTGATRIGLVHVSNLVASPIVGIREEDMGSVLSSRLNQANLITRLEQLHGVTTGFEPEPNWLIPLPDSDVANDTLTVTYKTDLVGFNYSCRWQVPDDIIMGTGTIIDGETWSDWFVRTSDVSGAVNHTSTVVQLTPDNNATGVSAFLFMGGGNMTQLTESPETTLTDEPVEDTMHYQWTDVSQWEIDLTNQPTVDLREMTNNLEVPPLATLLICDPQLYFTTGVARLSPVPDRFTPDVTVEYDNPNAKRIGNVEPGTARDLFSWALSKTSGPISDHLDTDTDSMGLALFLSPSRNSDNTTLRFSPRDPKFVERNLNMYMLSALKAFTGGYVGNSSAPVAEASSQNYTATYAQYDNARLALATSIPFALGYSILLIVTTCGLVALNYLNSTQQHTRFDLGSVEEELTKKHIWKSGWEREASGSGF